MTNGMSIEQLADQKHKETMIASAKAFVSQLNDLGINTEGFNVSSNLYGVSIYFKGFDSFGRVFNFRFSDHDCQRANGEYDKVSPNTAADWCLNYEKFVYPERFEWIYFDKWITRLDGKRVQVKQFVGRKAA